jgi:hypothetical protein
MPRFTEVETMTKSASDAFEVIQQIKDKLETLEQIGREASRRELEVETNLALAAALVALRGANPVNDSAARQIKSAREQLVDVLGKRRAS